MIFITIVTGIKKKTTYKLQVKFRTVRTQKWEKPSTVVKKRTWTK